MPRWAMICSLVAWLPLWIFVILNVVASSKHDHFSDDAGSQLFRSWLDNAKDLPAHFLRVPREAPDAKGEYSFKPRWISQQLDHFNKQHPGRFWQRYFVYDFFSQPEENYPLFVFCGAEQGDIQLEWEHYGFMVEFAREQGAKILWLEHRFFGKSMPFKEEEAFQARADRVGLLSIEQSLEDYAEIIRKYKKEGPVMTFGGSLSGTIAVLMRIQYPTLVDFAYGSSAPIFGLTGIADQFSWQRRLTENFAELGGADCPGLVRTGFASFLSPNRARLHQAFDTCEAEPTDDQLNIILGRVWSFLDMIGTYVYPASISGIDLACQQMRKGFASSREAIFAQLLHLLPSQLLPGDRCMNLTRIQNNRGPTDPSDLGWLYLACTEIIHPIGANNRTDMFPPQNWTLSSLQVMCNRSWNVIPDEGFLQRKLDIRIEGEGTSAHIVKNPALPGKVLLTYGRYDPWATMVPKDGWADDVLSFEVPGGAHCSDLETPQEFDTASMVKARKNISRILEDWIYDVRPQRLLKRRSFGEQAPNLRGFGQRVLAATGTKTS